LEGEIMRAFANLGRLAFIAGLWLALLLAPGVVRACDVYNLASQSLTIPQVIVGNTVYLDVVVALGIADVRSVGAAVANPGAIAYDVYDVQTGLLTIPCVTVGAATFSNVVTGIQGVISVGGATAAPTTPVLVPHFPLADAVVGANYNQLLVDDVVPHSNYTIGIDSLANGSLPSGMTIHFDGTLSGTPFATGATDVNGWQVPHRYNFGVCATDTLSRVTTSPCPQASVLVNPTRILASVVGNGSVAASPAGNACGANCYEGFPLGTNVTLTATAGVGSAVTGWSGCTSAAGSVCSVSASGTKTVVVTFAPAAASLTGTWVGPWSWVGPASNGCTAHDSGTMTLQLTQNGSSVTGSIEATGFQTLNATTGCSVVSTDPDSGTFSATVAGNGSSVTYAFSFPDVASLSFSGAAVIANGNTFTSTSLTRATGGSGSFSHTRQSPRPRPTAA
jgi:hypothetical protein